MTSFTIYPATSLADKARLAALAKEANRLKYNQRIDNIVNTLEKEIIRVLAESNSSYAEVEVDKDLHKLLKKPFWGKNSCERNYLLQKIQEVTGFKPEKVSVFSKTKIDIIEYKAYRVRVNF